MAGDLRRLRVDRDKKSVPHCIVHACMNGLFFLTTELHRSFSSYITFTTLLHHFCIIPSVYTSLLQHFCITFTSFLQLIRHFHPLCHLYITPLPERVDSGFSGCAGKVSQLRNKLRTRSPFSVGFGADFKSSGLNSGQNRPRVSPVHSHA